MKQTGRMGFPSQINETGEDLPLRLVLRSWVKFSVQFDPLPPITQVVDADMKSSSVVVEIG